MKNTSVWMCGLISVSLSCASSGTKPADMGAAHHEEMARVEAERANAHEMAAKRSCPGYESDAACYRYWTSFRNPTKTQFDQARQHRELAEKHRVASQALRDAEARSCAGIPAEERDVSPFFHTEDIIRVEKIGAESHGDVLVGVRVVFRPLPGMTADWLQRVVDCHVARNAAVGFEHLHMEYCPLAAKGVTAVVRPVGDGLAVEIRPSDEGGSRQVDLRTAALRRERAAEAGTQQGIQVDVKEEKAGSAR